MRFIDIESLRQRKMQIEQDYKSKKPFHFIVFEGLFRKEVVESIFASYPDIKNGQWDGTTYIDQKNKFQKTKFDSDSIFNGVFEELNSEPFLKWLEEITGITDLLGDADLFGGGLHQSISGAFLNVHVDYNIHPKTKFHRRLNVLVYMNKDWRDSYDGHLELWNVTDTEKKLLAKIAPVFNRCVIFETNEVSYHGHPKPLKTPPEINRKSIATYYYTQERPQTEVVGEHNTIYVNTEGVGGQFKRLLSGVVAIAERLGLKGSDDK